MAATRETRRPSDRAETEGQCRPQATTAGGRALDHGLCDRGKTVLWLRMYACSVSMKPYMSIERIPAGRQVWDCDASKECRDTDLFNAKQLNKGFVADVACDRRDRRWTPRHARHTDAATSRRADAGRSARPVDARPLTPPTPSLSDPPVPMRPIA